MSVPFRAAVLTLATVATLLAAPPETGTAATAATGWVEGVAVDGAGRPVTGALVNVLRAGEVPEAGLVAERTDRRTWTGRDGSFRVRQGVGGYLVQLCRADPEVRTVCRETAQGVDFVLTYVGGSGVSDSWVLQQSLLPTTGATRDLGAVTVQPKAGVAGTLRGARPREEVRLLRLDGSVAFTTWTDRQGRYALDGIVPGRYRVAAGGAGRLPWSSAPVTLRPGVPTRVDGALRRGAAILGTLRSPTGPVARAELIVEQRGRGRVAAAVTDRRGRFEVGGLTRGRYVVRLEAGGAWRPSSLAVTIGRRDQTVRPTVPARRGGEVAARVAAGATVELRDRRGRPLLTSVADESGQVRFTGLAGGRYTLVADGRDGFGIQAARVRAGRTTRLAAIALDRDFLTVRGRTAPHAVVEATTGDLCPADGTHRYGGFHEIATADARGRYRIGRLVPGRYMLGADGWPRRHAPRCWSGVRVQRDRSVDLPLQVGARATGRLVYAGTSRPVITTLSYELFHRPGLSTNPTEEHPARARTRAATGRFTIERLTPGAAVTGRLARQAGDGITDLRFSVVFPFQDGTPYWLDTAARRLTVPASGTVALGDVPVTVHGRRT